MSNNALHAAERPGILGLVLPYWRSAERWKAMALLVVILTISFTTLYAHIALNDVQGKTTDALIELDWSTIKPLLLLTFGYGLITVLLPITSTIFQDYLKLRWRTWVTRGLIERWTLVLPAGLPKFHSMDGLDQSAQRPALGLQQGSGPAAPHQHQAR
ncbi:hypothetical protein [Pseudomonas trivialis]|uniref:hypothetical protein n=1 Tax=Pseudomonas trivialis TaxID=200450 RepID=UPI000A9A5AA3|nr:hypothetical protein [Pseudomonas trivialis]